MQRGFQSQARETKQTTSRKTRKVCKMDKRLKTLLRDESGITALETAIILIAFVVVASVFAFTILSAGTFSTERSREAVYSGLEQISSSMEVYGSVVAEANPAKTQVVTMTFTLANVAGGAGVNITGTNHASGNTNNVVVMSYRDSSQAISELEWDVSFIGSDDGDWLLEEGELAEVEVILNSAGNGITLAENTQFQIEVKPPQGGVLPILRGTPPSLDSVMSLN